MAIGNGGAGGGGQPQPQQQLAPPPVTPATPLFKLVLLLVFSLTVAAMVASTCLVIWDPSSKETKQVIDAFTKGYLMGLAGILGLIGGRVM